MEHADVRVLVFAPIGRDGPASAELLRRAGLRSLACGSLGDLIAQIKIGASAVFIAEEGLFGKDLADLFSWVAEQPAWSDLPFVILTSQQEQPGVARWRKRLADYLRNVSFLERPVQPITLSSAIQAAARARSRQYQMRGLLDARERAAQLLEAEVADRTSELRREITERAQVEEKLRQSQKIEAIGQLTGGVAHDFNNLLMVISGGLEMLDRGTDPSRRQRLLDGMRHAAERGTALTRQLLAFSRRQELKPESVDLAHHIEGMRELLDRSLSGDISVTLAFGPDLWPVEVDPGELELVILNLAVNARDAMPNGGTIHITAHNAAGVEDPELTGDFVRLCVSDTGAGMPPEVLEHVFEPFFTTKEIGKGSGLGLPQVYGFAKQSGGAVYVNSAVNRGTTIVMLLPRALIPGGVPPLTVADVDISKESPRSGGAVLLVEDDDEVASTVAEMLAKLGYAVTRAASAEEALGSLNGGLTIDVVFSDVMMPGGMNGVDLARVLRAHRQDLPILLTSANVDAANALATELGVQILRKPYRLIDLSNALNRCLC
jgi:signal transduction histidine kinase/CheY-like chemotaxis protein